MHRDGPDPKETIEILDQLVSGDLTDRQFREMHHLGDSIVGFRKYCGNIKSFRPDGNNQKLGVKLEEMLEP